MHILVLYQYFQSPDAPGTGRHYSFVRSWAQRHEVTVVTAHSELTRPLSQRFPAAPAGVRLESFPVDYANRMGIGRRLRAYRHFARSAVEFGKRIERPDVIFGTSTPLTVGWAARKLARHWGVPWIFEVRDLWPDFPIQMGAVPGRWLQEWLRKLESSLYRDADHVVTLSPDMERHVLERGGSRGRVTTLLNGTSFELLDAADPSTPELLRARFGLGRRKVILYAGSFGRANGIPAILEAARLLRDRDDLIFVFVGSGYARDAIDLAAAAQPNLVSVPPVPKYAIFDWHRLADLSLVTFIDLPVLATNSPSKFFDSLACGTPVLVTNTGWTRTFVEAHHCGWFIDALTPDRLAATITQLADRPEDLVERGRNGTVVARSLFDRQQMADSLEATMADVVARSQTR